MNDRALARARLFSLMRKVAAGLALGLGAAGIVLLLAWAGWLETAELKTYDWRMRRVADPSSVRKDVVLVEINDTTIRDLAPALGRWPWPRVAMATLIDFLNRGPAKVIAIDIGFWEEQRNVTFKVGGDEGQTWKGEDSDAALVQAVARGGNVVLLADTVYEGVEGKQATQVASWRSLPYRLDSAIEERPLILPPFQKLTDAARALGHNYLVIDPDGPARRMAPFVRVGDRYLPSLGIATALVAADIRPEEVSLEGQNIRIRDRLVPLVPEVSVGGARSGTSQVPRTMLIDYRAPARLPDGRPPYTSYEARHLLLAEDQLQSGEKPLIDPAEFKDKIVFVGLTASGTLDVFTSPFGENGITPGIQLHATMADNVLSDRFLRPPARGIRIATTLAAAVVVGLLAGMLPFMAAGIGTAVLAAAWTSATVAAFARGHWFPMTEPLLAMALTLFAGTAYQYFVEDREKRKVKRLFGRYVSKDICAQLLDNPAGAELGGARREMSVLFSDIRGFTSMTEQGEPEALVGQLNEYFSAMVQIVFRHDGTIDKFVGDMVMALFGAPLEDAEHADKAVKAAQEMIAELAALNRKWAAEKRPQLDIGIGVNSGEMIAGNIGSSAIMSYTVIGDNVNLGSRLEALNKEYGTRIIISDATRQRLKDTYDLRPLGDVVVKGKTRPVAIFEVAARSPISRTTEAYL